jgi:hypothetical protein
MRWARAVAALIVVFWPVHAVAQDGIAVQADLLFYGDNTEFRNPFREGETIFGAAVQLAGVVHLNDRVKFSIGGFGNQRFGSERSFERVRPVIALTVVGARSAFVFGTLPLRPVNPPPGPDRAGPHGLLPPLQRETLSFDRPYEAGLQWTFRGDVLRNDFWLAWQRLNTPDYRERFDGGSNLGLRLRDWVTLPAQLHVVHEGGQLYASGAVADSLASAAGVMFQKTLARSLNASVELYGAASRHVPDRSRPGESIDGTGFLARASGEQDGWRGHVLFWRGRSFVKDEGDPNYLSLRRDGTRYTGTRDYSEAGLTRRFTLAASAVLDASFRVHRVEKDYQYSFRIMSVVSSVWTIR